MNKNLIVSSVDAEEQGEVSIRTSDVPGNVIVGLNDTKMQIAGSELKAMLAAVLEFMEKEKSNA